jgi:hypothetical protein
MSARSAVFELGDLGCQAGGTRGLGHRCRRGVELVGTELLVTDDPHVVPGSIRYASPASIRSGAIGACDVDVFRRDDAQRRS